MIVRRTRDLVVCQKGKTLLNLCQSHELQRRCFASGRIDMFSVYYFIHCCPFANIRACDDPHAAWQLNAYFSTTNGLLTKHFSEKNNREVHLDREKRSVHVTSVRLTSARHVDNRPPVFAVGRCLASTVYQQRCSHCQDQRQHHNSVEPNMPAVFLPIVHDLSRAKLPPKQHLRALSLLSTCLHDGKHDSSAFVLLPRDPPQRQRMLHVQQYLSPAADEHRAVHLSQHRIPTLSPHRQSRLRGHHLSNAIQDRTFRSHESHYDHRACLANLHYFRGNTRLRRRRVLRGLRSIHLGFEHEQLQHVWKHFRFATRRNPWNAISERRTNNGGCFH